jgi:hypothetical protein
MTFDKHLRQLAEQYARWRQVPGCDQFELAIAYFTAHQSDTGEITADWKKLSELFSLTRDGDLAEVGLLFRRMVIDESGVEKAFEYARLCYEEDRERARDVAQEIGYGR